VLIKEDVLKFVNETINSNNGLVKLLKSFMIPTNHFENYDRDFQFTWSVDNSLKDLIDINQIKDRTNSIKSSPEYNNYNEPCRIAINEGNDYLSIKGKATNKRNNSLEI
jgi:hypothetical protein